MPRDSSGNYTLPLGNPVIDGTVIDVNWANPTMSDIAVQLNNVITRDGLLGPTGQFYAIDGTIALPGISFASQHGTGFSRDVAGMHVSVAGAEKGLWATGGLNVTGALGANQAATSPIAIVANSASATGTRIVLQNGGVSRGDIGLGPSILTGLTIDDVAIAAGGRIAFGAGGLNVVQAMFSTTGSLGIGTGLAVPTLKLHVAVNTAAADGVSISNAAGATLNLLVNGPAAPVPIWNNSAVIEANVGAADLILSGFSGSIICTTGNTRTEKFRVDSGGTLVAGAAVPVYNGGPGNLNLISGNGQLTIRHTAATAGRWWQMSMDGTSAISINTNVGAGVQMAYGATAWSPLSDERDKTSLEPILDALAKVASLRSVTGRYLFDDENGYTRRRSFLIAQDVQDVLPEAVYEIVPRNMDPESREVLPARLGLAYTEVIPLLVAAIKELKTFVGA